MEAASALKSQYRAGLAMLRQAVERFPSEAWLGGEHPRNPWRIAYHAVFYTHLYLQPSSDDFQPWAGHRDTIAELWRMPPMVTAYSQAQVIEYIDLVAGKIDALIDRLDLESSATGFSWYPEMTKLEHQMMNLRHLQGHVGQLSEILMAQGIEIDWKGKA
jgi:hypothetical protein